MRKRVAEYAVWLLLAAGLYFFENNTGTRIALLLSLGLPVLPAARRILFAPDEAERRLRTAERDIRTCLPAETEEPGDVRDYLPGDPVSRIHWKLSAKWDRLLIREQAKEFGAEAAERKAARPEPAERSGSAGRRIRIAGWTAIGASCLMLLLLPAARDGMQALLNRLFEASEAVNAYAYDYFPVPRDQPVSPAILPLAVILTAWLLMTAFSGSRAMGLVPAAGCVLFQIYFGLAFPAWANVLLAAAFILWMTKRPRTGKSMIPALAAAAAVILAVTLIRPGVDPAVEAASERVRDQLSRAALQIAGAGREQPAGISETRHTHALSLNTGEQEARTDREYRLIITEEEQISSPPWISGLRIFLLLCLALALLTLPFLPFLLLNRKRRKAEEIRRLFQSEDISEAVCAIFQQVIVRLELMGCGAGNLPYLAWKETVSASFPPEYVRLYEQCARLFEEAAYSNHPLREESRQSALALLRETREHLLAGADRKKRLYFRYKEWLWGSGQGEF